LFEFIKPNNIKIFAKKPLNGGIPAIEKNKKRNETAHKLFTLNKFERLDKNSGVDAFLLNIFILY
jgi:hypothetical protein